MALFLCPSGLYISTAFKMESISETVKILGSLRPIFGVSNKRVGFTSNWPSSTKNLKKERMLEMHLACVLFVTPTSPTYSR